MSLQFDAAYYLEQNPDVAEAVEAGVFASAEAHWEQYGAAEERNPNADFNTSEYLAANPDVAQAGVNPLTHFLTYGAAEGRAPSAAYAEVAEGFDEAAYLEANTDVAAAVDAGDFASGYEHWVKFGQFEDARPEATYNEGTPVSDAIGGETAPSELTEALSNLNTANNAKADFIEGLELDTDFDGEVDIEAGDAEEGDVATLVTNAEDAVDANVAGDFAGSSDRVRQAFLEDQQDANAKELSDAQEALADAQADVAAVPGLEQAYSNLSTAEDTQENAQKAVTQAQAQLNAAVAAYETYNSDITVAADGTVTGLIELDTDGNLVLASGVSESTNEGITDVLEASIAKEAADEALSDAKAAVAAAQEAVNELDLSDGGQVALQKVADAMTIVSLDEDELPTSAQIDAEIDGLEALVATANAEAQASSEAASEAASTYDVEQSEAASASDAASAAASTYDVEQSEAVSASDAASEAASTYTVEASEAESASTVAADAESDYNSAVAAGEPQSTIDSLSDAASDAASTYDVEQSEAASASDAASDAASTYAVEQSEAESASTAASEAASTYQEELSDADSASTAADEAQSEYAADSTAASEAQDDLDTFEGQVTTYENAADSENPLTQTLSDAEDRVEAAEDAIADLAEAVENLEAAEALEAELEGLNEAIDQAEQNFEDLGFEVPVTLSTGANLATADSDIFLVGEGDSSITNFGLLGDDTLYIGDDYTLNTGDIDEDGDNSVLEVFLIQNGANTEVTLETEPFGSNSSDAEQVITLTGVSAEDVTVDGGMITVA